ncbi:MAG TPA: A/G-specific adenine glycosylase [Thermoanaerobaculia bacterium]|nr:A/G-specific adenine glycosylase [Thermoanaerobaculia bacterium]
MRQADALLTWFDRHQRELPWRQTRDPYRIWLSEVMLQQTRVETVLPYYHRFLEKFPTVDDLARADVDEVLALWSGLGYYRRARQLHEAARQAVARGGMPRTEEELRDLPGIGAYTAAAVASIAFGVPSPVLDGNVERVLSRWLALGLDPKSREARERMLTAAADLLDPRRPGDSNQALMELGATVCAPRRPRCLLCPLASGCRAALAGDPERFPVARAKRVRERHRLAVAVSLREDGVLLFRRPEESTLLAGTWELPWTRLETEPSAGLQEGLAERYGGRWALGPRLGGVRHTITYRDLEVEIHQADLIAPPREQGTWGWFGEGERSNLPLSSLVEKVLREVALFPRGGDGLAPGGDQEGGAAVTRPRPARSLARRRG